MRVIFASYQVIQSDIFFSNLFLYGNTLLVNLQ